MIFRKIQEIQILFYQCIIEYNFRNKEYKFKFDTKLYTGVYKYIISGVLLDEKTNKGLEGVEVILGGINQIIN